MTNLNKSKEELSIELQELKQELSLLKTSYEKDIAKARQNEIKLQISEAQKKAILNGISANIAFVDKDLKIIWANKTAAQSVNKNPDEMVGHNCHHFWGDPKNPCENCPSLKAFESKKSEQIIINTPNGKIWEEKGEPIFDEAGNLIGVVEIATDITERKQVENENGKIQKLLEDSQRIGKIGGWEFNIDTLELKWTKEMYNIHEVDLNFKPNVDQRNNFYTPESIPVVNNAVHRAIEFGEPYEIDSEIITAKGNRRSVKSIGKPDLENRRIFGLFQDITDRKRTEKALQESEEKYRILVENSLVGVVQTKLNGEVLYVNDAFVKMYEAASAEEFIGKNMTGVYKYNRDRDEVLRLLKKDGRVDNYEVVGLTTKGNEKTRLLSAKISGEVINGLVFDITERKNAEEALRKSEQMLRETGRIAKLGGWEIDLATENLKWSDETYRIHEVDPHSQPLIEDGISFYAPEAQPILKEAVEHAIKGGVPFDLELPFITAKGKSLWVRSIGKTEHVDGQTIRLFGVFQDITERKLAEDALLKSEQKLETMLQTMVEGMVTIDLTGEITYCNKAAKQILGMDKTVLGKYFQSREWNQIDDKGNPYPEEQLPLAIALREQRTVTNVEHALISNNGEIKWLSVNAAPLMDGKGQLFGGIASFRDITQHKQAEELLQKSQFNLNNAQHLAHLGSWEWDMISNTLTFSDEFSRIFGLNTETPTISVDLLTEFIHPDDKEFFLSNLEKAATNGESKPFEYRVVRPDGDVRNILASGNVIFDESHKPVRGTGVIQDITERKKAEEELLKSKEEFKDLSNQLEAILDHIPGPVFYKDKLNNFIRVNKYMADAYHKNKEDLEGVNLSDLYPEDVARQYFQDDLSVISSRSAKLNIEEFWHTPKGLKWVSTSKIPFIGENGDITGVIGVSMDITERKKAEQTLHETNAYLENLINYANAPIIVWDPQFRITRFNHAFEFITGHTEAEVLGKSLEILFPPELSENSMALIHKTLMGERWKTVEIKIQHINKSVRTLLWNSATLFMPDGKTPIATIAQGHDITERKATEEALAQSRSELKAIYDFSPVMMCLVDANRKIIFANPAFTALTGTEEDLLKGGHACGVFGCINAKDDVRGCGFGDNCQSCSLKRAMDDTFKNGTGHINVEYHTTLLQNGETRKLSLLGSTALIESNNQRNLLLCLNDITERKQMEDKLEESSTRLLLAARAGGVGIWDWDLINNILVWDDQMFALYGITKNQFGGAYEAWLAGVHPDYKVQGNAEIQRALNGEIEFDTEFKVLWPDGSIHDIRALAIILRNSSGKPLRMIGTNWDITGQKKTEAEIKQRNEELRELNATKDKFFSIIAHDLKSPFNSIMGFSELLIEQIKGNDYTGIEKYAQIILHSSERAVDLLMNLMEWSRSQTGRMEFNPEYFELIDFIDEVANLFKDIAGQKSISIKKELPHNAPVFADKAMINTVFRNLISNAIKFTKPGGEILISVIEKPDEITFSVKDSGVGISADRIDKLFQIDESYSTTGTNNEKGTGLGLILCKEFIEKHGGRIWVESVLDKGSMFSFSLPVN